MDEIRFRHEKVNLLMVDDDSIDVEMFIRSLKKNEICNPVFVANDGQEALELLRSGQITKPFIVILDLNMPRMNGIEFLHAVREDKNLQDSVIFVMTTSDADKDRVEAYNLNVAGYMVKSEVGESFLMAVTLIDQYRRTVVLPY